MFNTTEYLEPDLETVHLVWVIDLLLLKMIRFLTSRDVNQILTTYTYIDLCTSCASIASFVC